jgi:excisionase family DNA binding protein
VDEARSGWLTAQQVADHLGCTRSFVYEHAAELGGVRMGSSRQSRLRFRLEDVDAAMTSRRLRVEQTPEAPAPRTRRSARRRSDVPLLPIKGRKP